SQTFKEYPSSPHGDQISQGFDVRCSTSDVRRSTFDVRRSTSDVRCSMFDVRCSTFDVRCSMFDVRCSTFDVRRSMSDVRRPTSDLLRSTRAPLRPIRALLRFVVCPTLRSRCLDARTANIQPQHGRAYEHNHAATATHGLPFPADPPGPLVRKILLAPGGTL